MFFYISIICFRSAIFLAFHAFN